MFSESTLNRYPKKLIAWCFHSRLKAALASRRWRVVTGVDARANTRRKLGPRPLSALEIDENCAAARRGEDYPALRVPLISTFAFNKKIRQTLLGKQ
jgi:hypothetical protein